MIGTPTESELSAPLEGLIVKLLTRRRARNLIYWFLGEFAACIFGIWLIENRDIRQIVSDYYAIVALGCAGINGNLFVLVHFSAYARRLLPYLEGVVGDSSVVMNIYKTVIFRRATIYLWMVITLILGPATFAVLGLNTPRGTTVFIFSMLLLIFGSLGMMIGFFSNIWTFLIILGALDIKVEPTHADRMGGLKPIGDLHTAMLYSGAMIGAIYSLGCYVAPYRHVDIKQYAYLWIVGAFVLYLLAVFVPTYRIHRVLIDAKQKYQQRLSQLKGKVLPAFERVWSGDALSQPQTGHQHRNEAINEVHLVIDALKYFQDELDKMFSWPYQSISRTLLKLASIQGVVTILSNWERIGGLVGKVVR